MLRSQLRHNRVVVEERAVEVMAFRVTSVFYSSFLASSSSSLLELIWRVSFYPFCLGLYLPWPKAITVDRTMK